MCHIIANFNHFLLLKKAPVNMFIVFRPNLCRSMDEWLTFWCDLNLDLYASTLNESAGRPVRVWDRGELGRGAVWKGRSITMFRNRYNFEEVPLLRDKRYMTLKCELMRASPVLMMGTQLWFCGVETVFFVESNYGGF